MKILTEKVTETPRRVTKASKEYFKGYKQEITSELLKTFGDVNGYDDMVLQKNISVQSHCEHHMVPIIGVAHVAYLPNKRVVGLSKLARVVAIFKKITNTREINNANRRNFDERFRCTRSCCHNRLYTSVHDNERN